MKKTLKITLIIVGIILILSSLFIAIFINNIMGINNVKFDKEKLMTVNQEVVIYDKNNDSIDLNSVNSNDYFKLTKVKEISLWDLFLLLNIK